MPAEFSAANSCIIGSCCKQACKPSQRQHSLDGNRTRLCRRQLGKSRSGFTLLCLTVKAESTLCVQQPACCCIFGLQRCIYADSCVSNAGTPVATCVPQLATLYADRLCTVAPGGCTGKHSTGSQAAGFCFLCLGCSATAEARGVEVNQLLQEVYSIRSYLAQAVHDLLP